MIPTISFLEDNFNIFNNKYFSNRLKMPEFILGTQPGYWGRFNCDGEYNLFSGKVTSFSNPRIEMTTAYSRAENSVLNTLLHEMIHYYVVDIMRRNEGTHGRRFERFARLVNRDGWDVRDTNDILPTDIYLGK